MWSGYIRLGIYPKNDVAVTTQVESAARETPSMLSALVCNSALAPFAGTNE